MRLKKIIEKLDNIKKVEGKTSPEIRGLSCDSRTVKDGCLFIAVRGSRFNGADFINEAIDRGARAVVVEIADRKRFAFRSGVTFIYVDGVASALSKLAATFYGDISGKMFLIGVSGTNGKTTTTYLLEALFKINSDPAGVIGTINYRFGGRVIPALNTTPGALDLYALLNNMYKSGIKNCILEVSSHSLREQRVDTIRFDTAVFTNLTPEHLDYHGSMQDYLASKMMLFTKIKKGGYAVINRDDPSSGEIIKKVRSEKKAEIITYGMGSDSHVYAEDIRLSLEGIRFRLCFKQGLLQKFSPSLPRRPEAAIEIYSPLIGRHNVYNILAGIACFVTMGMRPEDMRLGIESVTALPGRLERIDCGQDFLVFVDYAHTENGLENVLKTLRGLNPRRLLTVFGCGGDRDRSKRPNMGRVSSELSDKIFITSDNPRSEEPMDIIKEIVSGIAKKKDYVIEAERARAISEALREAKREDIVLIAGKGHETYQIFKDTVVPFDDREVVRRLLSQRITKEGKPCFQ